MNTLTNTACQSEGLGPRAARVVASGFNMGKGLTEADGGVGCFGDGELLACGKWEVRLEEEE